LTVLEPVVSRIEPIFSPRLWGTRSLAPFFPDQTNLKEPLGEAWLTGTDCRIANGPFSGKSLGESWRAMPIEWRGYNLSSYSDFPVLVKLIFPNDKLSIQVHPDDAYASKNEKAAGGRGKTEMWHIVCAKPGAELLFDLKPGVTKQDFLNGLNNRTLENLLEHVPVHEGETYFVPAGTQHAMGPGMVVCEVQEYSDLTYRVYDFGRVDASGKPRELHIDKALDVTKFGGNSAGKIEPMALHSPDAKKYLLAACQFFATERWDCFKTTLIESDPNHFQLIVILEGSGKFYDSESEFEYLSGQTWFLPASLSVTMLHPMGPTTLMRIFVPEIDSLRQQLRNMGFDEASLSRVLIG
jgi:mannose-6-phosphate isomerase